MCSKRADLFFGGSPEEERLESRKFILSTKEEKG
jgi:hypothetical protein